MEPIKEKITKHVYVDQLPSINLSSNFLIIKSAYETLAEDWLSFINYFIQYDIPASSTNTKNSLVNFKQKYTISSNEFLGIATDRVLEVFGFKGILNVIAQRNVNGGLKFVAQTSYPELIEILQGDGSLKVGNLINANTMVDRFFLYQYANNQLLYPIAYGRQIISRNYTFKHIIASQKVMSSFAEYLNVKHSNQSSIGNYISTFVHLWTATNIFDVKAIKEEHIKNLEDYIVQHGLNTTKKGDTYLYLLNELRRMLVQSGRADIEVPKNRQENDAIDKNDPSRFLAKSIDIQIYPHLEVLLLKAQEFMFSLQVEGLGSRTIKTAAYNIKILLSYLMEKHPHSQVNIELIESIFNPAIKDNLLSYIKTKRSNSSAGSVIGYIARFLNYMELVTPYVLKHIPRIKKIKRVSARKAMPKHMLKHLVDILTNRPPKSKTTWDPNKANLDWWKHKDVYPVFPIMILIHMFIPLRGSQIRNLCRNKSFELDMYGKIQTIIVNTDKNTGRTYLQEIPNVWEELEIVSNFLKWHKEYFPNLPAIVYNDDENSRWENITPLMITPKNYKPISQHTHMNYFKRVLAQYQLEANLSFKKQGNDNRVQILSSKKQKALPNSIDALNEKTDGYFSSLKSEYDIHSLRVTGATRYLEAGLGISLVMKLTGHTSPDMLLNVYNKLQLEEKRELLSTAVKKIFLIDGEDTPEKLQNFLLDEMSNSYDANKPEKIEKAFHANGLFSMQRKSSSESLGGAQISSGTDIAKTSHPSTWSPMIFGICPGTKCPDGRENRCSLCPYLITGRVFLDGVIHQANLKLINFYRLSKEIYEEQNKNYENSGKSERIDLLFEEVMGWFEVINKIEKELYSQVNLPLIHDTNKQIIGTSIEPIEIAYLKTNYNAIKMGVEKDHHGLAVLMIKAFHMARKSEFKELESVLENETRTIDWLMSIYLDKKENNMLPSFLKQLQ